MKNKQIKPSKYFIVDGLKQITEVYEVEQVRVFSNPICKQTFDSLPKIYGKQKNKVKLHSPMNKQVISAKNKNLYNNSELLNNSQNITKMNWKLHIQPSVMKKINSLNYHPEINDDHDQSHNHIKQPIKTLKFISHHKSLPQKPKKLSLKQTQSSHKVVQKKILSQTFYPTTKTELQNIIDKNENTKKINKSTTKNYLHRKKYNFTKIKNRYLKTKQLNNVKNDVEEDSSEEGNKSNEENEQICRIIIKKQQERDQKNYDIDQQPPLQLNPLILKRTKFNNTKLQHENSMKVSSERPHQNPKLSKSEIIENSKSQKTLKSQNNQQSNVHPPLPKDLFTIPEQPQYENFLKTYKTINPNMNITQIIKSPQFRILKAEKEVYFGQTNQQLSKHGKGVNIASTQIYEGQYFSGEKSCGYEKNIDGVYMGGYVNGVRSGHGAFEWNNGEIYEGNWTGGMKSGFGVWKSLNGSSYEGNWLLNRQHGQGILIHRNSTYKGHFKKSMKDGPGEEHFQNGDTYNGEYKNGKPQGMGRYEWSQGGYYEGQFFKGIRDGKGQYVDKNGNTYEGQFKKDFKHGYGKQLYISGQRFEGQFYKGNKKNGKFYDKNLNQIQFVPK